MIATTSEATRVLALHASHADDAQRAQIEVAEAAGRLAHTLDKLADHAREEMQIINSTAVALQEQLAKNSDTEMWVAFGARAWGLMLAFGQVVLRGASLSRVAAQIRRRGCSGPGMARVRCPPPRFQLDRHCLQVYLVFHSLFLLAICGKYREGRYWFMLIRE